MHACVCVLGKLFNIRILFFAALIPFCFILGSGVCVWFCSLSLFAKMVELSLYAYTHGRTHSRSHTHSQYSVTLCPMKRFSRLNAKKRRCCVTKASRNFVLCSEQRTTYFNLRVRWWNAFQLQIPWVHFSSELSLCVWRRRNNLWIQILI